MKVFITSKFSYFSLIWMFHSRNLNIKINQIHEGALRLVYKNNLSFSELLDPGNSVTVHQKSTISRFYSRKLQKILRQLEKIHQRFLYS